MLLSRFRVLTSGPPVCRSFSRLGKGFRAVRASGAQAAAPQGWQAGRVRPPEHNTRTQVVSCRPLHKEGVGTTSEIAHEPSNFSRPRHLISGGTSTSGQARGQSEESGRSKVKPNMGGFLVIFNFIFVFPHISEDSSFSTRIYLIMVRNRTSFGGICRACDTTHTHTHQCPAP